MDSPSFVSSLSAVLILIFVLFGAYLAAKLAGISMKRMSCSRYMKILDRINISKDRAVVLIQVGERVLVVGTAAQGMQTIAELSLSELQAVQEEQGSQLSFRDIWKNTLNNMAIPHFPWQPGTKDYTDEEIQ